MSTASLWVVISGVLWAPAPVDDVRLRAYDDQRVIIDTVFVEHDGGGRFMVPKDFRPRTGSGKQLAGAEFYAYVDRPDLARRYEARTRQRWLLGGVGIGMFAIGTGLTLSYIGVDGKPGEALLGVGLGLMLGAAIPVAVAGFRSPHPVSGREAAHLATQKNVRLRTELAMPKSIRVDFSPLASRHGGGAQLSARF